MGKRLNLKWVSDEIGDTYKDWKYGDIVTINAQTGTGKTYFITGNNKEKGLIDNINVEENILYLCNRLELKNQIKIDLMRKYDIEIPYLDKKGKKVLDIEKIEKITRIKNVTIMSYHQVAEYLLDREYSNKEYRLDIFNYIICDECHYFLTDASFNNKTYIAFKELIETKHSNMIKIFISATIDEVQAGINKYLSDSKIHTYSTGIDYSYLDVKYFDDIKNIATIIKNDKTDEKWIVFISSKKQGDKLKELLDNSDVSNSFITANTKTEESLNITKDSTFNCKVLISTKCLDNGVNIKDKNLKNLVVIATDKTTFIQEIGRVRFKINDAPNINLYIYKSYKKAFTTRNEMIYQPKKEDIDLFTRNIDAFKRKYNNDHHKVPTDIFYQDANNNWRINDIGIVRLDRDIKFAVKMELEFKSDEWAFIKEQLNWLNLGHTFDEINFIENVVDEDDKCDLRGYLNCLFEDKVAFLQAKDRTPLIEAIGLIDKHNSSLGVKEGKDTVIKYIKNITTLNSYLKEELGLEYSIKQFETSRIVDGTKKKFKQAWKIVKTIE